MTNGRESSRVSILTPVFNGADYLAECIESVLSQTYSNWDYTIFDNFSTDDSAAVAEKYARADPRIRIIRSDRHVPVLESHNRTAGLLSADSKYCKFVFADDWLYPACIEEMVRLAEESQSVGLVCAYTMDGISVRWHGPPYPCRAVSGRETCRRRLLGGPYVFGTMTSVLVRSDLIRKRVPFFKDTHLQADLEACFDILQESDFAFVHQVLSFSRERKQGTDSFAASLNSHRLGDFIVFLKYGPKLLKGPEYERRSKTMRREYYRMLAHNVLRLRPRQFWRYHNQALRAVGSGIDGWSLAAAVIAELTDQVTHPVNALIGGRHWWSASLRKADRKRLDDYRQSAPSRR